MLDDRSAVQSADPSLLAAACQRVKDAITFDNIAGTVTFHLQQAWGPFFVTLAGPWGSVVDQNWVKNHGGWDGSCTTWQNYYAPPFDYKTSVVGSGENGTGPFMLSDWTSDEIDLVRNPSYWRTIPAWTGGPSGLAALTWIKVKNVGDSATRATMLINGDADLGTFSTADYPSMDAQLMLSYIQGHADPILLNPNGILKRYEAVKGISATDGLFNYNINSNSTTNLIGSGRLDGNGIPPNFFTDIHVRKAFNYAFDWDSFIQSAYGGNAIQHRGPIIAGLPGYSDTQPVFTHDATQALSEFAQAWGGQVFSQGFTFTIAYNTGSYPREKFCEILKAGIEALNPKFHINIMDISASDLNFLDSFIPLAPRGWQQDISDPYNWVYPYMAPGGIFTSIQNMPNVLLDQFSPKIDLCIQSVGTAAASCYADLQNMAYEQAIDIFGAQPLIENYVRNEVQGYYANPALGYEPYFYALSKSSSPIINTATPTASVTVSFTEPTGVADSLTIPSGSFNQNVNLVVSPGGIAAGQTSGFRLGEQGFDISVFATDGSQLHPTFNTGNPVQITVHYNPASLNGIFANTMKLYYLNPQSGSWEDASCGTTQLNQANETITVPVCHFSRFALGGNGYYIYLPLTKR
jgi:peptide/nickel transport system substrate-binding protein